VSDEVEVIFSGLPAGDFWVFAYGSLMWNPDFIFFESAPAGLDFYKRSLCVWSWHHRGTEKNPGLVFGLDKTCNKTDCCEGRAFLVSSQHRCDVLTRLKSRELITDIYQPKMLQLQLANEVISALTFVVDPCHKQYANNLPLRRCVDIINKAKGKSGSNIDYVIETWRYLKSSGVDDKALEALCIELLAQ
jgi:cation transport protein ChaC